MLDKLNDGEQRLITIVGQGGSGKTRFALACAHAVADHFVDGAWLVNLATINAHHHDPAVTRRLILQRTAAVFKLSLNPRIHVFDQLAEYMKGRHALLVLDNMEHLLAAADIVAELLREMPQVSIIVTTREPLNLRAESLIHLKGLEEPSPSSVHTEWDQIAAVQMFVDAARRFVPQYAVDATNWDDIVLLCGQVGGSPLGLELAAAQLRLRPLRELVAQYQCINRSAANIIARYADTPP